MKKHSIAQQVATFLVLFAFWLVMSGSFTPLHLALGVLSVICVQIINYRLDHHNFFPDERQSWKGFRLGYALGYLGWLIAQIFYSAIHVARVIIHRKMPMETFLVKFKVNLTSAQERFILGNSITLTPGTLTVEIENDEFTVHALTSQSLAGIINDDMPRRVARLFQPEPGPVIHDLRYLNGGQGS